MIFIETKQFTGISIGCYLLKNDNVTPDGITSVAVVFCGNARPDFNNPSIIEIPKNMVIILFDQTNEFLGLKIKVRFEILEKILKEIRMIYPIETTELLVHGPGLLEGLAWNIMYPETFNTMVLFGNLAKFQEIGSWQFFLSVMLKNILKIFMRKNSRNTDCVTEGFGRQPGLSLGNNNRGWNMAWAYIRVLQSLRRFIAKYFIDLGLPVLGFPQKTKSNGMVKPVLQLFGNRIDIDENLAINFNSEKPGLTDIMWNRTFDFYESMNPTKVITIKPLESISRVLITGATGFIGSTLVKSLVSRGLVVNALVRSRQNALSLLGSAPNLSFFEGDLTNRDTLISACKAIDVVVHCAGQVGDWGTPQYFQKVNVDGTSVLLDAAQARKVKQFILISSLGVFGDKDQADISENSQFFHSSDNYSNSKIKQEYLVRKFCKINRIPFTIVRPGFVYGKTDTNFLPNLISILQKNAFKYIGDGTNRVNTVYVDNVVNLIGKIMGNPECYFHSFNITDPNQVTIKTFIDQVAIELHMKPPQTHVPEALTLFLASALEFFYRTVHCKHAPKLTRKKITFLARDRLINSNKAYGLLGDEVVSFKAGLAKSLIVNFQ